ncbi:MAG TPA: PfkB family carbohydrate kinase [Pseudomonadales bacterium]
MRILICGTLAYDDIGAFDTPLGPESRNVKLHRLDRGFGGCAMNIAFNLAGLGHQPVPFVYAGDDYSGAYARHVAASGISETGIFRVSGTPSARGIVLTGSDGAQFTAFYPGPSGVERWADDLDAVLSEGPFDAAVLAPDLPEKTLGCAERVASLPLVLWCPGQYAELLERPQIESMLGRIRMLVVNRHEWNALGRHVPGERVLRHRLQVVITDGPGPAELLPGGTLVPVPPVPAEQVVDPTGCGDAFVAALLAALLDGSPLPQAVAAGHRLAAGCLASRGAQAHRVSRGAHRHDVGGFCPDT